MPSDEAFARSASGAHYPATVYFMRPSRESIDALSPPVVASDLARYFFVFAVGLTTTFAAVAFTNWVVDPFQFFRISSPPRFATTMQRHQHPGLIRNYPFDSIVVGSSPGANLRPNMFQRLIPDIHVKNLTLAGGTLFESAEVVRLALATKPLKAVYWEIGSQRIESDYRYPGFPSCLYNAHVASFPYCYLLNLAIFKESLILLGKPELSAPTEGAAEPEIHSLLTRLGRAGWVPPTAASDLSTWLVSWSNADWSPDPVNWLTYGHIPMSWHDFACDLRRFIASPEEVDARTARLKQGFEPTESSRTARFAQLVFPVVDAHPETRFIFFFPPIYLGDYWYNWALLRGEHAFFKRELIKRRNVEVYDFQMYAEITHDISAYRDSTHFNSESAQLLADAMAQRQFRVTDLASDTEMLRREIDYGGMLVHGFFDETCQ
jgi:hypothetical protein